MQARDFFRHHGYTGHINGSLSPWPAPQPSAGSSQDDSAASFIGALISLTSHSNIRYQGILSNIDAAQATLSLEKGMHISPLTFAQCTLGVQKDAVRLLGTHRTKFLKMIRSMIILCFVQQTW